jgi:hypothetical protein
VAVLSVAGVRGQVIIEVRGHEVLRTRTGGMK